MPATVGGISEPACRASLPLRIPVLPMHLAAMPSQARRTRAIPHGIAFLVPARQRLLYITDATTLDTVRQRPPPGDRRMAELTRCDGCRSPPVPSPGPDFCNCPRVGLHAAISANPCAPSPRTHDAGNRLFDSFPRRVPHTDFRTRALDAPLHAGAHAAHPGWGRTTCHTRWHARCQQDRDHQVLRHCMCAPGRRQHVHHPSWRITRSCGERCPQSLLSPPWRS